MILINLLPWRERLEQEQKRQFLLRALIGFSLTAVLVIALRFWVQEQLSRQQQINTRFKQEIQQLDNKITAIKALEEQKQHLIAQMAIIHALQSNRSQPVRLFAQLARIIPDGVYLTNIKREAETITLMGKATTNGEVAKLLRDIAHGNGFHAAQLVEIKADTNEAAYNIDFILQFKLR